MPNRVRKSSHIWHNFALIAMQHILTQNLRSKCIYIVRTDSAYRIKARNFWKYTNTTTTTRLPYPCRPIFQKTIFFGKTTIQIKKIAMKQSSDRTNAVFFCKLYKLLLWVSFHSSQCCFPWKWIQPFAQSAVANHRLRCCHDCILLYCTAYKPR